MVDPVSDDIRDSRSVTRFIVDQPIPAIFENSEISIFDFAEKGLQAEHEEPVRLGSIGDLTILMNPESVTLRCKVMWSHLSDKPNSKGKYLYRTGFLVEDGPDAARLALQALLSSFAAEPDDESLKRKRHKLLSRTKKKKETSRAKYLTHRKDIDDDTLLLIQHARSHLKANPDEARKWYNRAKFSMTGKEDLSHREDVLAVWEYLERSVDVELIAKVFADRK